MQGKVTFINTKRGLYAVQVEEGDYTVFELLDTCEISLHDAISGNLDSDGGETLFNKTKNEKFEAFIEGHHCDLTCVSRMLKT